MLVAVAAGRHPLVDAVQTPGLLEALDLVLRVEALNGCGGERKRQDYVSGAVLLGPERQVKDETSDGLIDAKKTKYINAGVSVTLCTHIQMVKIKIIFPSLQKIFFSHCWRCGALAQLKP